jgi:hypothetical protein
MASVDEPVEQGLGDDRVGEQRVRVNRGPVAGHDQGAASPLGDQLVRVIGLGGGQLAHAEVDEDEDEDEDGGAGELAEPFVIGKVSSHLPGAIPAWFTAACQSLAARSPAAEVPNRLTSLAHTTAAHLQADNQTRNTLIQISLDVAKNYRSYRMINRERRTSSLTDQEGCRRVSGNRLGTISVTYRRLIPVTQE